MTDTPTHPIDKELVAKRFSYSRSTYDREASVQAVSDALARLVQARTGNYFAFFPSYAYLRQVHEDFAARYPGIRTLVQ